ncbi:hypothetical protein D3C78_1882520 [compost metagenome]
MQQYKTIRSDHTHTLAIPVSLWHFFGVTKPNLLFSQYSDAQRFQIGFLCMVCSFTHRQQSDSRSHLGNFPANALW